MSCARRLYTELLIPLTSPSIIYRQPGNYKNLIGGRITIKIHPRGIKVYRPHGYGRQAWLVFNDKCYFKPFDGGGFEEVEYERARQLIQDRIMEFCDGFENRPRDLLRRLPLPIATEIKYQVLLSLKAFVYLDPHDYFADTNYVAWFKEDFTWPIDTNVVVKKDFISAVLRFDIMTVAIHTNCVVIKHNGSTYEITKNKPCKIRISTLLRTLETICPQKKSQKKTGLEALPLPISDEIRYHLRQGIMAVAPWV